MFHVFTIYIVYNYGTDPPGGFKDPEETRVVMIHVFVVIIRFEVTVGRPPGLPLASGGILLYLAIILY